MHDVVGSALRHMTAHAIRLRRMRYGSDRFQRRCSMTALANAVVPLRCGGSARNIVRIVTRGAAKLFIARLILSLEEALRFTQAVSRIYDFKSLVISAGLIE